MVVILYHAPKWGVKTYRQSLPGGLRTDTYYRFIHRQNNSPENLWSYPYAVINRANVLLNAIETGDLPAGDELNNAKGEALALRALCHFNLLITYGKPYFVRKMELLRV